MVKAKIETQDVNQEVTVRVIYKQPSNLTHKVWVVDCVSKDGCSDIHLTCFRLCNSIEHNFIVFSVLGMEIVLVCSLTPTQKQTSETRTHMQAVYLGDDPRKYY